MLAFGHHRRNGIPTPREDSKSDGLLLLDHYPSKSLGKRDDRIANAHYSARRLVSGLTRVARRAGT